MAKHPPFDAVPGFEKKAWVQMLQKTNQQNPILAALKKKKNHFSHH